MVPASNNDPKAMIKKTEAPESRRNELAWNITLLFVLTYLQVFGYAQLAKPFCAREPHTLPKSFLSDNYPCDGTVLDKVLYLGTQPWRVYSDYLRLQHSDCWVSASALCLLLRLVLALVNPGSTRYKWVTVAHRLVAPLTLLAWVLTYRQEPSILATWFIRSWPLLDCSYVLVFPTSVRLEAAYGVTSFIVSLLLGLNIQSGRPHLGYTLATCAVSSAWIQYVHVCWAKAQPADGSIGGRNGRGSDGCCDSGSAAGGCCQQSSGCAAAAAAADEGHAVRRARRGVVGAGEVGDCDGAVGDGGGTGRGPGGGGAGTDAEAVVAGTAGTAAGAAASAASGSSGGDGGASAGGSGGGDDDRVGADGAGLVSSSAAAPGPDRHRAADAGAGDVTLLQRVLPSAPTPPPAQVADEATMTMIWSPYTGPVAVNRQPYRRPPSDDLVTERDDAGGHGRRIPGPYDAPTSDAVGVLAAATAPRVSYVPVVRLVRMQLKIDGADPEQVTPGYEDRIARVVAAAGYELDSVYMRRGCIELVVNARSWQDPTRSSETAGDPTAAVENLSLGAEGAPVMAAAAAEDPGEGPGASMATAGAMALPRGGAATSSSVAGSHHHRLLMGSAGVSGGGGAIVKNVVVVDIRSLPARGAPASTAVANATTATDSIVTDGAQGSCPEAPRNRLAATATAMASPMAASGSRLKEPPPAATAAAAAEPSSPRGDGDADIDIGAIIRALGLDRSGSVQVDDAADYGEAADVEPGRWDSGHTNCDGGGGGGGGGVDHAATAAAMSSQGRDRSAATDPWTHPALLLQPLSPAPPPPTSSSPAAAAVAVVPAEELVVRSPTRRTGPGPDPGLDQGPGRDVAWGRCALSHDPGADASDAAAEGADAPLWWVGVYPRALCPGAVPHSTAPAAAPVTAAAAAATPDGTVYGPFHLDISVVWPPAPVAADCGGGCEPTAFPSSPSLAAASPPAVAPLSPPPSLDQLQLLLRSRGLHLTARVLEVAPMVPPPAVVAAAAVTPARATAAGAAHTLGDEGTCTALRYSLEVPYLPTKAGLLLLDVVGVAAVPVVLLDDPEAVAELQGAVDGWAGSAAELDDLLYDISMFAQGVADAAADAAAPLQLNPRFMSLGCHLLAFSDRNGWTALGALLQRAISASASAAAATAAAAQTHGLRRLPVALHNGRGGGAGDGRAAPCSVAGAAGGRGAAAAASGVFRHDCGAGEEVRTGGGSGGDNLRGSPVGLAAMPSPSLSWWRPASAVARLLSSLWEAPAPRGCDAEGFRSYRASWRATQAYVIQWLDALLLALCVTKLLCEWRRRPEALGAAAFSGVIALLGTAPGLASAAAWVLLPREVWLRVVERCVVLRQATNCLAKLLLGCSRWRPLPCFREYEQGMGVWLVEGVMLPVASLLSPAAALLMAAARAPLLTRSWLVLAGAAVGVGGGGGAEELCAAARCRKAVLRGCGIAGLSVATSLACHWCLCQGYRRRQHQQLSRRSHHHHHPHHHPHIKLE